MSSKKSKEDNEDETFSSDSSKMSNSLKTDEDMKDNDAKIPII